MQTLNNLYTIGYSPFLINDFISVLNRENIKAIVDVRANAFSPHFDSYNYENIKITLNNNNIYYLHLGDSLGARPKDKKLYTNNYVDFNKVVKSSLFLAGCERLLKGLEKFNICLMCAQKDPIICHRSILITHYLSSKYGNLNIQHLLPDRTESQTDLDKRVIQQYEKFKYSNSLINTEVSNDYESLINDAYAFQAKNIAYTPQKI